MCESLDSHVSASTQFVDEFQSTRPLPEPRHGIEVADSAHVNYTAAPRIRHLYDLSDPRKRVVRAGCNDARKRQPHLWNWQPAVLTQDVHRRITVWQGRLEIGRCREQRAPD